MIRIPVRISAEATARGWTSTEQTSVLNGVMMFHCFDGLGRKHLLGFNGQRYVWA